MYYKTYYASPLGKLLLVSDGKNLCGLWFEGQKYFAAKLGDTMPENNSLEVFKSAKNWLDRYFARQKPDSKELPLKPQGTEFQKKVWKILCGIQYGSVITYGDIAKRLNPLSRSAQAVGGAVGHNPISIIIPCHRVVGANNSLTGYATGIETKKKLLELEGVIFSYSQLPPTTY